MTYDRNHPFLAKLTERKTLNQPGSKKCTMHLSLDISGSHITYKVGDSIAVYAKNSEIVVQKTLGALGFEGSEKIQDPRKKDTLTLRDFLTERANISKVTKKWLQFLLEHLTQEKRELTRLLEPDQKEELKIYCQKRELWDSIQEFELENLDPQDVVNQLGALLPRFYSIASSSKKTPHAIDLVIAYFHYCTNEHLRHGVASHYLCEAAPMHLPAIAMYLHPSKDFTLPDDPSTPIIMIGPGTGVAPFRGFMQERVFTKSPGKNWLFFGDWNKSYDFFYEEEWLELVKQGHLKLSTAFSRDQDQKVYVQHRMHEEASELWSWLESGAYFYVCGDAQQMARDVDAMLHQIIEEQGQLSAEKAIDYVKDLRASGRYLRDVY